MTPSPPLVLLLLLFLLPLPFLPTISTRRRSPRLNCRLRLKNMAEHAPLLLRPDGPPDPTGFLQPDPAGYLDMVVGDRVRVACPGPNNTLDALNQTEAVSTCVAGTNFTSKSVRFDLETAGCRIQPKRLGEATGRTCGFRNRGIEISLGFRLNDDFVSIVRSCFDQRNLSAIYSNYTLVGAIAGKRSGGERPEFRSEGFYGNVSPRRQFEEQNKTLKSLLGSTTYLRRNSLTKGHLAARAGFVYWPEKRATFFYVNTAPQWMSINAGNWAALERSTRNLAARRGDLLIITGIYGVLALNNSRGVETTLYLAPGRKMPVPELFWKVVYDAKKSEGVAIIAANNPFAPLKERLCPDLCGRLRWLVWEQANRTLGEGYCCEVDALRLRVPDVPALQVKGLLTG